MKFPIAFFIIINGIVVVIGFVPVSWIIIIIRLFQCNYDCYCLLIVFN